MSLAGEAPDFFPPHVVHAPHSGFGTVHRGRILAGALHFSSNGHLSSCICPVRLSCMRYYRGLACFAHCLPRAAVLTEALYPDSMRAPIDSPDLQCM